MTTWQLKKIERSRARSTRASTSCDRAGKQKVIAAAAKGELPSGRVRWKRAPMGTLDAAAANVQGMVRASGAPAEAIGIGGHQQEDQQRPLQQRSLALHSPCFAQDPDEISTRSSSGCP